MVELFATPFLFWYGFLFIFVLCGGISAVLHCGFLFSYLRLTPKWYHYAIYLAGFYFIAALSIQLKLSFFMDNMLFFIYIIGFSFVVSHTETKLNESVLSAIISICIYSLLGALNETIMSCIYSNFTFSQFQTLIIGILCTTVQILITAYLYRSICKNIRVETTIEYKYFFVLLIPFLFLIIFSQVVLDRVKMEGRNGSYAPHRTHIILNDSKMLIIYLLAFICFLVILLAYKKLLFYWKSALEKDALEQQLQFQKIYLQEIRTQINLTQSFRHDLKNHLSVLNDLITTNKTQETHEYFSKLLESADQLSYPVNSDNAVIDSLLSQKFGFANQSNIHIDCSVKIPKDTNLDSFDLCILLGNALDNAISACQRSNNSLKKIKVSAWKTDGFFIFEVSNLCDSPRKSIGIGLSNIRSIAEKYNGTVNIDVSKDCYTLSVLLSLDS